MKKILYICVALLLFALTSFGVCSLRGSFSNITLGDTSKNNLNNGNTAEPENSDFSENGGEDGASELRAVWLTYYEISDMCKGKTKEYFRKAANTLLTELSASGINTVFYQARAFADALYTSKLFPVSLYISDNGKTEYDPLEVFIGCAKDFKISVHAWVNPFRVSYSTDISSLEASHPARVLYEKNGDSLIICEKGIYFNPSCADAARLIIDGIRELINGYCIDGIQFDDYFYPPCEFDGDKNSYSDYKENGGGLSLADFRRECVSEFVGSVYSVVKAHNEALLFGISPSAKIEYNENTLYADVLRWCSEAGFVDYIMPQIYYGFENETAPFESVAKRWRESVTCKGIKLYCGLALYKAGEVDENAGGGSFEWTKNTDILKRQYLFSVKSGYNGYSLFSCKYFSPGNGNEFSQAEIKSLCDVLQ